MTTQTEQQIVRKLLENIRKTDCGVNQVCYHKEWYDKELKGGLGKNVGNF